MCAEEAEYLAPVVVAGADATHDALPAGRRIPIEIRHDTAGDSAGNNDAPMHDAGTFVHDTADSGDPQYAASPGHHATEEQGRPLYATADASDAEHADANSVSPRALHPAMRTSHFVRLLSIANCALTPPATRLPQHPPTSANPHMHCLRSGLNNASLWGFLTTVNL